MCNGRTGIVGSMIGLDAAELLSQWATGLMLAGWITTRHRLVSRGYGYLIRLTAAVLLAGAVYASTGADIELSAGLPAVVLAVLGASGLFALVRARRDDVDPDPIWDLVVGAGGLLGLLVHVGVTYDPIALALVRTAVGALFLGTLSCGMLLGHWYLLQPGLTRAPLIELVWLLVALWPIELAAQLWPTGMTSVISGDINAGSGGLLGWFWIGCVVLTLILVIVTRLALRESQYEAVMAATGLLYLAILTGFGMDLISRALLVPA
jgi:hypothetical protein